MAIPTATDHKLAEIDDLHGTVMVRLRTYTHAGANRDPRSIREAAQTYVDKVVEFVNADQRS